MNPSYFTEEHQLFRESLKIFYKEVVPHIENGKKRAIELHMGSRNGLFGIIIRRFKLICFLTVIFLEELQKIKSSGFAAYVGTFLFSHDTLKCRRRRKN
jgi:hypothetical protein